LEYKKDNAIIVDGNSYYGFTAKEGDFNYKVILGYIIMGPEVNMIKLSLKHINKGNIVYSSGSMVSDSIFYVSDVDSCNNSIELTNPSDKSKKVIENVRNKTDRIKVIEDVILCEQNGLGEEIIHFNI
jgi:hypothetical protein